MVSLRLVISFLILALSVLFYSCKDDYEIHALAIRNYTIDSIKVERHYTSSIHPRSHYVASEEYEIFFETSTQIWTYPANELSKICDSLIIFVKDTRISLTPNHSRNYCKSPYSIGSTWDRVVEVFEVPKMIGTKTETKYIHVFNIESNCIVNN